MNNWICCLMVSGITLSDEACLALNEMARNMFRARREEMRVRNQYVEGKVVTKFAYYSVGALVGILFEATAESDAGKGTVRYLFKPTKADHDAIELAEISAEWESVRWLPEFIPTGEHLTFH
jgi:hypothetical protein